MTSLPHGMIRFLAPPRCIICSKEDNAVCAGCAATLPSCPARCCLCGQPGQDWHICHACRSDSPLLWLQARFAYEGRVVDLLHQLKFERGRDVAAPLARAIAATLPRLAGWVVVPVPTAPGRIRVRGYDQADLLAKALARILRLPYSPLLGRLADSRQVGANRSQRRRQAQSLFYVRRPRQLGTAPILLVDDVCTTGATLNAAAHALAAAGAGEIAAAVVAWKEKNQA